MRLALVLVLAGGCIAQPEPPPPDDGYGSGGGGWTGSGGDPISHGCRLDSECAGQVCARDGACYPATSIRAVHASWTIAGQPATETTCTSHPHLTIHFTAAAVTGESFGYAPVPCENGRFTVDKLPTKYTRVDLGPESGTTETSATIDINGDAAIDLPW
jgi:hypothetical protein